MSFDYQILLDQNILSDIKSTQLIQKLWKGYGELLRVQSSNDSVILKYIRFPKDPHPRKVKSYQAETNWYKDYNQKIDFAYTPQYISSGEIEGAQFLILEDLHKKNYQTKIDISWKQTKICLKWLANFHSHYMNKTPKELWEIGTYWHLATRPDELKAMSDERLKQVAPLIDQKLNSAKYKTIVHGDAKLANFLFNQDSVAAVDFQYVGGGVGIKDVAYFLSSLFHEEELFEKEQVCLDYYFQQLNNTDIEQEWRKLYPFAWADFYRFLQGWSPGHWKMHRYSESIKNKVLECL